jgi:hypothetical protein
MVDACTVLNSSVGFRTIFYIFIMFTKILCLTATPDTVTLSIDAPVDLSIYFTAVFFVSPGIYTFSYIRR